MSAKESLARAQLAIESGRALFRAGILVECHAYMALALRSLLDAWAPTVGASTADARADDAQADDARADDATTPHERREQALLTLGRSKYRHVPRLAAAYHAVASEAPREARSIRPLRERDYEWIWREVDRLHQFTSRHLAPAEARRRFRIRLALVLTPIALVIAMILTVQRVRPQVVASASFADHYAPELAVDWLEATEWLLPDGTEGWLDLTFRKPRRVRSVTLVNCHNGAFVDRSSGKVRVTAYSHGKPVASAEGEFEKISSERAALDLPLVGEAVTRVRVEVLSTFGRGGGFAEVEVH